MAGSNTTAAPPWPPNWRDANQYPINLTDAQWRWQFLRRRPDYQALWERPCDPSQVRTIHITGGRSIATQDETRIAGFQKELRQQFETQRQHVAEALRAAQASADRARIKELIDKWQKPGVDNDAEYQARIDNLIDNLRRLIDTLNDKVQSYEESIAQIPDDATDAARAARSRPRDQTPLRALYIDEASRFGVRCILDPALPEIPRGITSDFWKPAASFDALEFTALLSQREPPSAEQWERWRSCGGYLVAHVLDLRFDLDEQIAARLKWLKVHQRKIRTPRRRTKDHRKLWSTYLRVLDARKSGASWRVIGQTPGLLSKKQRDNDSAKYAEQLYKQACRVLEVIVSTRQ